MRIAVIGGGAAGFFAAITAADALPSAHVVVLEKTNQFLAKVRISGGGRCNVTHACFEPQALSGFYPRGSKALLGPFYRFQPRDTVQWFESRGVRLKTEADGRMFPITDRSQTIIDSLMREAGRSKVELRANQAVNEILRSDQGFEVKGTSREVFDKVLLATGGCRSASAGELAVRLGHTLEPPVPSLFSFILKDSVLRDCAGIALPVKIEIPGMGLAETGPLLITHEGLSGPAILRLSAWGARAMHAQDYNFDVLINWYPSLDLERLGQEMDRLREAHPARLLVNTALSPVPLRLWERLVLNAGIARDTRWANLPRHQRHLLSASLLRTPLKVLGKSLNKDEFVTCGGVRLSEVNFRNMESKLCPGLFFAGELLDIDAVTGGFNFQAAWTTGYIAGQAMAED